MAASKRKVKNSPSSARFCFKQASFIYNGQIAVQEAEPAEKHLNTFLETTKPQST